MLLGSSHYCAEHVQWHVRSDLNPPVDLGQAPHQPSARNAARVLLSLLLVPCLLLSVVIVIVIITASRCFFGSTCDEAIAIIITSARNSTSCPLGERVGEGK